MGSPRLVVGFLVVLISVIGFEETSAVQNFWDIYQGEVGVQKQVYVPGIGMKNVPDIRTEIEYIDTKKSFKEAMDDTKMKYLNYMFDLLVLLEGTWTIYIPNQEVTTLEKFYQYIQYVYEKKTTPFEALAERLKAKHAVELDSGVAPVNFFNTTLKEVLLKPGNELNSDERDVLKYAFNELKDAGYQQRFRETLVNTWEQFSDLLNDAGKIRLLI